MIEKIKEDAGNLPGNVLADAGYSSGEQLLEAEKKGYEVLANLKETSSNMPYDSSAFAYQQEKDVLLCPEGKELKYESSYSYHRTDALVRRYKCTDYEGCNVRWLCSRNKTGRTVKLTPYIDAINRQKKKHMIEGNRILMKRRKAIIEPIFGWIKHIDNFRRFTVKGMENAKVQWSLICSTLNLRKIYQHWYTHRPNEKLFKPTIPQKLCLTGI